MTEERVPAQVTREEAKHYILLTLDRFRVMTLHLADNKSRLPSALNGNEGGLDLLYELEARDFYRNLMSLYTSDIFEVLSSEGLRELLLKCRELSDRFCLKVRIAEDIRVVGDPSAGELPLSQTEDADKESLWDSFLGALQGEFNEDPSVRSIFIDMGLNLIPLVGQAMDARDIIACLDKLVRQKRHQEIMVWVTLVLTAIGCVPGAGDVTKAIGKAIIKGADDITITLLKKLDAEDIHTAFVKFRQTLQASTEEALNNLTIQEYLGNIENYKKNGRGKEATKIQKKVRADVRRERINELRREGKSKIEAETLVDEWLRTQAALHNPDMSAGGSPFSVTGVGDARINSSIGSQWRNGRATFLEMQIRESIKSIDPKDYTTIFLNVKLTTE